MEKPKLLGGLGENRPYPYTRRPYQRARQRSGWEYNRPSSGGPVRAEFVAAVARLISILATAPATGLLLASLQITHIRT